MIKIDSIKAAIITDSRREKTIEATLTSGEFSANASVPCGKSKGDNEAFCYTVEKSKEIIEEITPKILAREFRDQTDFDNFLLEIDHTENKATLGVNVTLSLSIAFCRLYSLINQQEIYNTISHLSETKTGKFPLLFFNLINGGLHVPKSFFPLPFQEYLLIPKENSPKSSIETVFSFIKILKENLVKKNLPIHFGDEGGFIITGENPEIGFQYFQEILDQETTFTEGIYFGLDAAASSLWRKEKQDYYWNNGQNEFSWYSITLAEFYQNLASKYPLLSIEDPFNQESWDDSTILNGKIGGKVWLIGDDLTVTNVKRIKESKEKGCINAVLIKPNQIGTVSETLDAVRLVKSYGWKTIVSHRSGETNDTFIADLAFGVSADGLKSGSPLQNERLVKYNRLIEIENSLQ